VDTTNHSWCVDDGPSSGCGRGVTFERGALSEKDDRAGRHYLNT